MIDRGTRAPIRRGSANTNSEHEQSDACREVDTLFSKAGPVPDRCLCVHFFLDSGTGFIDATPLVSAQASANGRVRRREATT